MLVGSENEAAETNENGYVKGLAFHLKQQYGTFLL